jgi:uncharacterized membrane protein
VVVVFVFLFVFLQVVVRSSTVASGAVCGVRGGMRVRGIGEVVVVVVVVVPWCGWWKVLS